MTGQGKAIKQATKRVGRVLTSPIALTVAQAEIVLHALQTKYHDDLTASQIEALRGLKHIDSLETVNYQRSKDEHAPHENRGQVYHSDYALIEFQGVKIYLSFTYTICVKLPNLAGAGLDDIRSKFWFSAIIEEEFDPIDDEKRLSSCLKLIEKAADAVCKATLPIYIKAFEETVGEPVKIKSDKAISLNDLMLQLDDPAFRDCLEEIRDGELRIGDDEASESFQVLNSLYSGKSATTYLHCGRLNPNACENIDTVVETDVDWAHGFYIETRVGDTDTKSGRFELKGLGITSSSEKPGSDRIPEERAVAALSHSPAHTISAKRVADIGELF